MSAPTSPTRPGGLRGAFVYVVIAALAAIPLIYAGALIWANDDPLGHLDRIPAAIVNEDRGASITASDGTTTAVDLGAEVVEALVPAAEDANGSASPDAGSDAEGGGDGATNLDWRVVDHDDAEAGLADGEYLAVLTVPADFSERAVSSATSDPTALASASRGELSLRTDDAVSYLIGSIAKSIGVTVADALGQGVSAQYLEGLALGFGEIHESVAEAADGASRLATGADSLSTGTAAAADGAGSLASGLGRLAAEAAALPGSAQQLAAGGAAAQAGADRLAAGAGELATGTSALVGGAGDALAGAQQLQQGSAELLANWDALSDAQRRAAVAGLDAGLSGLVGTAGSSETPASGLSALAGGAAQLDAGVTGTLQPGAAELADGLGALSVGLDRLSSSTPALASAVASAASGAQQLAAGTGELRDGATQLDRGAGELANGLASGTASIPSFSGAEATTLGDLASAPVELDAQREHAVSSNGAGLAPYFLALGLWIGAFACFMMLPAVPERLLRGRRSATLTALAAWSRYALLGVAQSALAVLLVRDVIGVHVEHPWGLFGLAALTSLAFIALNQMLIALLGAPGRFIGLLLVVFQLTSAGGTYPIQTTPELFQRLHEILPLSYAVQGMRALIAGGTGGGGGAILAVWVLLGWLVGCVALTAVAVRLQRRRLGPAEALAVPRPA